MIAATRPAPLVHLRLGAPIDGYLYAPCGAQLSSPVACGVEAGEHVVALVTCPRCRAVVIEIATAYRDGRRNGAIPWATPEAAEVNVVRGRTNILEEQLPDGSWRFFRLERWIRERVGEYVLKLRVRERPAESGAVPTRRSR